MCGTTFKSYVNFTSKVGSKPDHMVATNHKEICLETVTHVISIGTAKGEIYNPLDVGNDTDNFWRSLMLEATSNTGHMQFKNKLHGLLHGEIEFVPQMYPHQPQLLVPAVPA